MGFCDSLLNFFVYILGGSLFIIFLIMSFISSISALLAISEKKRAAYEKSLKIVGGIILFYGLMLPFRHVSIIATLSALGWVSLLFNLIPFYQIVQIFAHLVVSLIFWIIHGFRCEDPSIQKVCDFTIFVIIPSIMTISNLSRGLETLSGKSSYNSVGPRIPFRSFQSKCLSLLETIFPPSK